MQFVMAFVVAWKSISSLVFCILCLVKLMCLCAFIISVQLDWRPILKPFTRLRPSKAESVVVDTSCIRIPRTCGRQRNRDNVPADNPKEYCKKIITIPFLDHILTQLNERFPDKNQKVVMGLSLVPSVVITDSDWKKNVLKMIDVYESDLPSPHNMDTELFSWQTKWGNNVGKVPNKLQDTLAQTDDLYFPNIRTLLQIICTIPVTTCSCERSISVLQ